MSASAVVYGLHAVRGLLLRSPARLRKLLVDVRRDDPRMREVLQLAQAAGIKPERVDGKQLAGRVGEANHQGVVAEIDALAPWHDDELVRGGGGCGRRHWCWCWMACRIPTTSVPACGPPMPVARWPWWCRRIARRA